MENEPIIMPRILDDPDYLLSVEGFTPGKINTLMGRAGMYGRRIGKTLPHFRAEDFKGKVLVCDSLTGTIDVLDAPADYRPIRYDFDSFGSLEFLVHNTINWEDTTEPFPIRHLRDAAQQKVPAALASLSRPKPIPQRKQLLMKATESVCKAITPVMPAYYDL